MNHTPEQLFSEKQVVYIPFPKKENPTDRCCGMFGIVKKAEYAKKKKDVPRRWVFYVKYRYQ